MSKQTGRCLCGAVAYEIEGDFLMCGVCHCKNCQRQAGSAFYIIAGVPKANFKLTRGNLKLFEDTADSGKKVQRKFCGDCGSPILSETADQPDAIFVKAGPQEYIGQIGPAGALAATATDMAKWMLMHLNEGSYNGAQILQPDTPTTFHTGSQAQRHGPRLHREQDSRLSRLWTWWRDRALPV